ncbi:hypothetical protein HLB23_28555 [Nocardia uniformis]|uniref:Uncharacterized protein n=1 Tax=Nocardia uniformis TaxID=53432 RepID=A0A849CEH7_9NOCA|nr:hypothetical protein [Nocardia uniformis]NNH73759.1 hypothetical protein [Nocardia uniformis]
MAAILITGAMLMGGVIGYAVLTADSKPYNARMYWCSAAYAALLIAPLMPSLTRAIAAAGGVAIGAIVLALRSTPFLSRRRPDGTRKVGHNDIHWPPAGRAVPHHA